MNRKVVIALSGGMDSATLLAHLLKNGYEVEAVSFEYGSKHNSHEKRCAEILAEYYGVILHHIDLTGVMAGFNSDLLKTGGDIPEGHYNDASMSRTVVPGRNIIFLSILSGLAWSRGASRVAVGIHAGDHAIYPDCRLGFYKAMDAAVSKGTDGNVLIMAPFVDWDKTKILQWGIPNGVPYRFTRTCYTDGPVSCGKCGSCSERLEAFRNIGKTDPVPYKS